MFNFELSKEHKMLESSVKEFVENEVKPLAEEFDQSPIHMTDEFLNIYRKMAELDFFAVMIPEEYGGVGEGFDVISCSIIHKELAKASAGIGLSYMPTIIVSGEIIRRLGTREQKEKYLPPSVTGDLIPCLCITEPDAGSDVGGIETEYTRDENDYIINGTKQFITNAPVANLFCALAKDKETGEISSFLVEKKEGVSTGKPLDKMGYRSSPTSECFF